jgi:hypothetical protein
VPRDFRTDAEGGATLRRLVDYFVGGVMTQHWLAVLFLAATTAHAASDGVRSAALTTDKLKSAYLDCESRATTEFLDAGDAANCSVVYEELKQRVFGGDLDRLLAWWRSQRDAEMNARDRMARGRR